MRGRGSEFHRRSIFSAVQKPLPQRKRHVQCTESWHHSRKQAACRSSAVDTRIRLVHDTYTGSVAFFSGVPSPHGGDILVGKVATRVYSGSRAASETFQNSYMSER